jgi:GGDEF domain-containing protein
MAHAAHENTVSNRRKPARRKPSRRELAIAPPAGSRPLWESVGRDHVTFDTARLEPRLAWALAAFAVWAAVVLGPGDAVAWLLAAFCSAIGAWSRVSPARKQWPMLLRAALLLVAGLALQVSGDTGGPTGPYFIWPVMVTAVYSLLLPGPWAIGLWGLALLEFAAARWLANAAPSWQLTLAQGGMLAFFAFVAAEFGHFMRGLDRQAELARKDLGSRLYNEAGFFAHGGRLFDECMRRRRPFAMVLLNSADLREVADLAGKKVANQLFAQLVQRIEAATPTGGIAARTDGTEFGLALPGMGAVRAAALLHEQLGQPPKVEVSLKGRTLTVMLDLAIAEATPDVPTLEDMYDRLRAKLPRHPAQAAPSVPADIHSTLQGMLDDDDALVPHHARPTMPMAYGEMLGARRRRR